MARLQFGQSYCQIEGEYVPVADFNLSGPFLAIRFTF